MDPGDLPHLDEHAVEIDAGTEVVWAALTRTVGRTLSGAGVQRVARLLGCEPAAASGARGTAGSSLAGFRVEAAEPPRLLVLTGRHRFSRYALVFRVEPDNGAVRWRAETRACFPGWHGRLYRAAVLGTRGHRFVVRRMLGTIKQHAERGHTAV